MFGNYFFYSVHGVAGSTAVAPAGAGATVLVSSVLASCSVVAGAADALVAVVEAVIAAAVVAAAVGDVPGCWRLWLDAGELWFKQPCSRVRGGVSRLEWRRSML